ncbi:MAG: DNA translocase FtsK [Acutalibacteraceae bacterium]|nr:DNA translocase FtsK [Acutalibacteraceae bacterium]
MAGTRKNTARTRASSNSGKKRTTTAKRSSGSRSNAKRQSSAQKTARNAVKAAGSGSNRQVGAIALFAAALFLLFVALIPGGNAWAALQSVLFGVFGVIAYVIPLLLIYVAVMTSMDRDVVNMRSKVIETIVLIFLICAAVDIFGSNGPRANYADAVGDAYLNAKAQHNGGAIGAIIGDALMILFASKVAAGITVLILIFVFILLVSGTTLTRFFQNLWSPVKKATDATSERFEARSHANEIRRKAKIANQVPASARKRPARFNVDVDLGPVPEEDGPILSNSSSTAKRQKGRKKAAKVEADNVADIAKTAATAMPAGESAADPKLDDIIKKASHRGQPQQPAHPAEPGKTVEPKKMTPAEKQAAEKAASQTEKAAEMAAAMASQTEAKPYQLPPLDCLKPPKIALGSVSEDELRENAEKLVQVLQNFGVKTSIVDIERGPSVTRYELAPAPGVKISKITNLADDIALNLAASGVRIEAPIPNKAAVGIEVPNKKRETVTLREILESPKYRDGTHKSKLNVALGRDIAGNVCMTDIAKMPHLLIAGTTGSGKSVCLNSMILSILYNASPDEVKLVMIDPKKVEFSVYNGIPHLLIPVVSDPHKASGALAWAVKEMLKRYKMFSENNVRDIRGYNELCEMDPDKKKMPSIVIFIDELADLMMASPAEVEDSICRLAQMARAAGMHLVIATQRPSVDVITGLIKANIPSRLSLSVSSAVDSRTILDMGGAEKLLGNGDMLFNPIGNSKPVRIQGCFTSDAEVEDVVKYIKNEETSEYSQDILDQIEKEAAAAENANKKGGAAAGGGDDQSDPLIDDAIKVVIEAGQASTTLVQRKLRVGYARAARIVDEMEEKGVIGPFEGSKPRKVLMTKQQWLEKNALAGDDDGSAAAIDMGVENNG